LRRLRRRIDGSFGHRRHRLFQRRAGLAVLTLLTAACFVGTAPAQTSAGAGAGAESDRGSTAEGGSGAERGSATERTTERAVASDTAPALDAFLDQVQTLTANFTQEIRAADGQVIETASGSVALSRPNRFRWIYEQPFEQQIVADGRNLWIYDVELQQVTRAPLDDTIASSPAMLLSGDKAVREGFDVVESFDRDGLSWVRLEPHLPGTDFRSVLIGFDGMAPKRLELEDTLNQVTRIDLTNVELNAKLKDRLFDFKPPRGVDVIGGD
jgi:chaperone LolA